MPIYEYECRKCGAVSEVFQKVDAKPPARCDKCGGRLERRISAPAIQFKGSGWYVTDYSSKGKASEKAESEAASSGGSDKKPDQTTKESSPVKKTSDKTSSTKSPSGD